MCGIIGRTGKDNAVPYLLDGLGKLEYRGYDSAGIAVTGDSGLLCCKEVGRLRNLVSRVSADCTDGTVGIGHTRWATHGEPSEINAHPHLSPDGRFAVVHNGIIENSDVLCEKLTEKLRSETDTEVVAHLLQKYYDGDPVKTISVVCGELKGSYALGILCSDFPDRIFCTASASPLVAAKGRDGCFLASDVSAVAEYTDEAYKISNGEICVMTRTELSFFDSKCNPISKEPSIIRTDSVSGGKQGYEHYMMLEIMQQPDAVRNTITPLIKDGGITLGDVRLDDSFFKNELKKLVIVACGSAYHTGLVGKRVIETLCRIPVNTEIASEFRYSDPMLDGGTLAVFISQSGETADTLAALRLAKSRGAKVLSIVNVTGSAIANESENVIYTKAGREIAVATTKAYSAQLSVLYALAIYISALRGTVSEERAAALVHELGMLPEKISRTLAETDEAAKQLSELLAGADDMYFIGRQLDYAAAMEASLKMKEISYIHSEAYAAGELKHGTISLIEKGTPVIAVAGDASVLPKTVSNVREVQARGARTVTVTMESLAGQASSSDALITVADTEPEFSVSLLVIPMQLTSYYTAKRRGCDIDKPKNLAKSVTVE